MGPTLDVLKRAAAGAEIPIVRAMFLVMCLMVAACGGAEAATTVPAVPSEPLVSFEASWLCSVQRFAFEDLEAIERERAAALSDAGFSEEEYEDFQRRLEADPDLRSEVKERFLAECSSVEVTPES